MHEHPTPPSPALDTVIRPRRGGGHEYYTGHAEGLPRWAPSPDSAWRFPSPRDAYQAKQLLHFCGTVIQL